MAVIAATPKGSTEAKVVRNCAWDLARDNDGVIFVGKQETAGSWWWTSTKAVASSGVVIFHSPLIFSFLLILWAKMLHKRIVLLVWDVYPVRIKGRRYDGRVSRRIVDRLERLCLRLSDLILVPSPDFLKDSSLARGESEPLWVEARRTGHGPFASAAFPNPAKGQPLQILFAGQVNATRGLDCALEKLEEVLQVPFVVKVASFSKLPAKLLSHPQVDFVGGLAPAELEAVAIGCHFGLVSLSPDLNGAGFPSKTFNYLAFGLPVLYFGPRLEYFTQLLERTGVGLDITNMREIPPDRLRALREELEEGRTRFIQETTLAPGRLGELLSRFGRGS